MLHATGYALGIVAQYGLIIPKKIIDAFPNGMINVHGSILPKYRGSSPIKRAGKWRKDTGITIILMDEKWIMGYFITSQNSNRYG